MAERLSLTPENAQNVANYLASTIVTKQQPQKYVRVNTDAAFAVISDSGRPYHEEIAKSAGLALYQDRKTYINMIHDAAQITYDPKNNRVILYRSSAGLNFMDSENKLIPKPRFDIGSQEFDEAKEQYNMKILNAHRTTGRLLIAAAQILTNQPSVWITLNEPNLNLEQVTL